MKSKRKILVIEDEPTVARGLKALLEVENYSVKVASNGADGVAMTSTFFPDLVLLDVNLPQMTGTEVCRQVRARGYANPIVMLTAQREQVDKIIGLEAGADDYITKPFDARELLARVRAHLRQMERIPARAVWRRDHKGYRKLLSIMFTDIKDYSKKINQNEKLALALLKAHNETVSKAVAQFGGRVIEIIGDAFMVSFESALKAVECGLAILQSFDRYNLKKSALEQIHVRIGIHIGDVLEIDNKLRGDAVNIAARLQQTATPDHIFISGSVFETVREKVKMKITRIGTRKVKNIRQPITMYRVTP
ncbi:MAG: response regulator [Bacteroidota bacterium]